MKLFDFLQSFRSYQKGVSLTISELQQKLIQLTAQPSESSTPPIGSHPSTPHTHTGYETYMNNLQKRLASISMPTGNILVRIISFNVLSIYVKYLIFIILLIYIL